LVIEDNYRPAEAEPLYREALAIWRKLHGNEHVDVGSSLAGLASALEFLGKYEEAEALYREALAIQRRLLGDEHPNVAASLNGLAYTIAKVGTRYDEAERLGREALALRRKLFGTDHPDLAQSISALARILKWREKWAEAESLYREVVEMRQRVLGKKHGYVYIMLTFLGDVLLSQGKLEEAEATYREVIEAKGELPESAARRQALEASGVGLAKVLRRQGRLDELLNLDADARILNHLAWFLAASGTRDGHVAVMLAEKAVALTSHTNAAILDTLAAAYAEAGQFTNAVNVQKEATALLKTEEEMKDYESRLRLYESRSPCRDHAILEYQARSLLKGTNFTEAELLARDCLAVCEKQMPDDWQTFNARSLLGASLLGQKKYAEAEPLLLSGYEGLKQRVTNDRLGPRSLREVLQQLVQLYEATDRPAQAAEWKQKLAKFEKAQTNRPPAAPSP
jgi:tetratricopeptide (TPR) repeat protein